MCNVARVHSLYDPIMVDDITFHQLYDICGNAYIIGNFIFIVTTNNINSLITNATIKKNVDNKGIPNTNRFKSIIKYITSTQTTEYVSTSEPHVKNLPLESNRYNDQFQNILTLADFAVAGNTFAKCSILIVQFIKGAALHC